MDARRRFHLIALIEGISFLLMLGIAMPVKYLAGEPRLVTWVGWAHGLLFIAYFFALAQVMLAERWRMSAGVMASLASLVPFGPWLFDAWLKKREEAGELVRS